ncbi:MAG: cutinase family protein [Corynebacterium sp.]|nr:cutinase family protein [Corynebacterium sp.]
MARRRRRSTFKVIFALIIIIVVVGGYIHWKNTPRPGEQAVPPAPAPSTTQPAWCKAYEVIAAPGTWESSQSDDPLNPTSHPNSFMLTVTRPLQQRLPANVEVWTLPYTAQFKNINDRNQMSYNDSRTEGTNRLNQQLNYVHSQCPLTKFVLMGFSQGAVIVGDVVNQIGNNKGPIPADTVAGVALVADGRRIQGQGIAVGSIPTGVGAEVSLQTLSPVIQFVVPGATMRGARDGGFGSLNDKTYEICANNDNICDAPLGVTDAAARALDLVANNGIHAQYATNPNVFPGSTTTQWLIDWVVNIAG